MDRDHERGRRRRAVLVLDEMMGSGLVTLEKVQVLHYGTGERD